MTGFFFYMVILEKYDDIWLENFKIKNIDI